MKTKKLKGSVLFTVIAVMMVVLVFIMSALTIAGATSRRAYSDYSKAQTKYTAHAALEATMKYLRDYEPYEKDTTVDPPTVLSWKNNAFGNAVAGLKTSSAEIKLPVSFSNVDPADSTKTINDPSVGTAEVRIKCINDKYKYTDGKEHAVIAITAIATLAGETSEETMIVLKDPPKKDLPLGGPNSLTSMSAVSGGSNPIVLGGASANVLTKPIDKMYIPNNGALIGETVINTNLETDTQPKIILGKGEGVAIYGNFKVAKNEVTILSEETLPADTDFKKVPYLFVERTFDTSSCTTVTIKGALNIFCGNFNLKSDNAEVKFNGNIYAFGTDANTINGNNKTTLLKWANSVVNPNSDTFSAGSLVCKGDLTLDKGTDKVFYGNVLTEGNLTINGGKVFIGGDSADNVTGTLYVGGKLTIMNGAEVYCKELVMTDTHNMEISGATLTVDKKKNTESGIVYDESAVQYPSSLTKAQITGNPDLGETLVEGNKIIQGVMNENMLKYVSFEGEGASKTPKYEKTYFKEYADVKDIFFKDDGTAKVTEYNNSTIPSCGSITSDNYSSGKLSVDNKITQTCIIKGEGGYIEGKTIVIDSGDESDNVIWVYLDNVKMRNGSIIITTGEGSVKFFSKSDVEIDGTGIYTDYYYKGIYLDSKLELHEVPSATQQVEIPRTYIYMDCKVDNLNLSVINGGCLTAYIFAPTAKLTAKASKNITDFNYTTKNNKLINVKTDINGGVNPAVIGSAFVGDYDTANIGAFVYINNNGDNPGDPTEVKTTWAVLSYQAGNEFMYAE